MAPVSRCSEALLLRHSSELGIYPDAIMKKIIIINYDSGISVGFMTRTDMLIIVRLTIPALGSAPVNQSSLLLHGTKILFPARRSCAQRALYTTAHEQLSTAFFWEFFAWSVWTIFWYSCIFQPAVPCDNNSPTAEKSLMQDVRDDVIDGGNRLGSKSNGNQEKPQLGEATRLQSRERKAWHQTSNKSPSCFEGVSNRKLFNTIILFRVFQCIKLNISR